MRKLNFIALSLLATLTVSCSGSKGKAIEAATKYGESYICTLVPGTKIKTFENRLGIKESDVIFIKGEQKKISYAAELAMENYKFSTDRRHDRKTDIIRHLNSASLDALGCGDVGEGFYVVPIYFIFGSENIELADIKIIVSKDLKVLNQPIDMDDINSRWDESGERIYPEIDF